MGFEEVFVQYWDQAITGFIGGLVVYLLMQNEVKFFRMKFKLNNKFSRAVYAFIVAILLVTIYSLIVYLFGNK